MSTLRDLIPLLSTLEQKRKEQAEAFLAVNRLLRPHGFSLYWDDIEERFCIYALPQTLDGTYQFGDETSEQWEADMARDCFFVRNKYSE